MSAAAISANRVRFEAVAAPEQDIEHVVGGGGAGDGGHDTVVGLERRSLRAAINAKCKECIFDPIGGFGTWRQQVEACTSPTCPLYPVRPTSRSAAPADEAAP